jgi:hypothetical protein
MREDANACTGEPAAVHDGCMAQLVRDHDVVATHQRGNDADIGHVARRERERGLTTEEFREPLLELFVDGEIPVDEP